LAQDDLLLPLPVCTSDLKPERVIAHSAFEIDALITKIDRSKTNIELPTVNVPSSDAINVNAILMRNAVWWSDVGAISSEVRSKVEASELLVLPETDPDPD
jgi:hypothetical protein